MLQKAVEIVVVNTFQQTFLKTEDDRLLQCMSGPIGPSNTALRLFCFHVACHMQQDDVSMHFCSNRRQQHATKNAFEETVVQPETIR